MRNKDLHLATGYACFRGQCSARAYDHVQIIIRVFITFWLGKEDKKGARYRFDAPCIVAIFCCSNIIMTRENEVIMAVTNLLALSNLLYNGLIVHMITQLSHLTARVDATTSSETTVKTRIQ